jgi:hypothetical protein
MIGGAQRPLWRSKNAASKPFCRLKLWKKVADRREDANYPTNSP